MHIIRFPCLYDSTYSLLCAKGVVHRSSGTVFIQLPAFIWFAVSFIVLFRYKHLLVQWIVFSALVGLVYTWMA
jgi:hypothetical protein